MTSRGSICAVIVFVVAGFSLPAGAQTIELTPLPLATNSVWTPVAVPTNANFALRLVGPHGQSAAVGTTLTITNATASLSNGIGRATITVSTNDWAAMTGSTGIHSNLWEVTITHQ
jgi:Na+/glutamate symporter